LAGDGFLRHFVASSSPPLDETITPAANRPRLTVLQPPASRTVIRFR
jgi:hypothetical protein